MHVAEQPVDEAEDNDRLYDATAELPGNQPGQTTTRATFDVLLLSCLLTPRSFGFSRVIFRVPLSRVTPCRAQLIGLSTNCYGTVISSVCPRPVGL